MQFVSKWVDVTKHLISGEAPTYLLERPLAHGQAKAWAGTTEIGRIGEFWTPRSPIVAGSDMQWGLTKTGEFVRIPVHAYRISSAAPSVLIAFGMQLGILAVEALRDHTLTVIEEATLLLGDTCHTIDEEPGVLRCYAGITFRLK